MVTTGFAESMRPMRNRTDRERSTRVTSDDWVTVGRWEDTPPSTNRFSIGVEALIDTTADGTEGEFRFVATDANGAVFTCEPVVVSDRGQYRTLWVEAKPQGSTPVVYTVEVQLRRTAGTGALMDVDLQPLWLSGPTSNVQECNPLVVAGVSSDWGTNSQTLANPIQGSGHSLIFIAVAPGPGFDASEGTSGSWVEPAGATDVFEFEVQDTAAQFVQRVRVWFIPAETGAADYTFGYDTPATWPAGFRTGSKVIIGLDGSAPSIAAFGPSVDTGTPLAYPVAPTSTGFLALALATGQNDDQITGTPTSGTWTEIVNNSAVAGVDRRNVAVFSQASVGTSVDPGDQVWSATTAAHAQWVLMVPCGSGGIPAPTFAPIDSSLLSYEIDPGNVNTWGPNRTNLQLVNAGSGWNPGQTTTGFTAAQAPGVAGYDLAWNGAGNQVDSFTMDSGESRRLWLGTAGGRPALKGATQYRPGASNYSNTNDVGGYNDDTLYPDADRVFQGGSRVLHYSDIDGYVRSGPGADEWIWYFAFATEEWMGAMDNTTCPFDFHSPNLPGGGLTSPFLSFIRENEVRFFTRDGQTADGGVPVPPATTNNNLGTTQLAQVPLEPVGTAQGFVIHGKIDPSTTDRFINIYKVDATGGVSTVIESTAKVGYWFSDDAAGSGQFYFLNQMYSFPAFTSTADAAAGIVDNWDDNTSRVGPNPTVREFNIIRAGAKANPAFTVANAIDDLRSFFGL